MLSFLKRNAHQFLRRFGVDIVRSASLESAFHHMGMRKIHSRDVTEIEDLYREFVFRDLPKNPGRAALLNELIGTGVGEAIYIVHHLHQSLATKGDVCEFGVSAGATSALLASELMQFAERKLWLFDSFEGLPAPTQKDRLINDIFSLGSMESYKGAMATSDSSVREKLRLIGFPEQRTKVIKGWIEDTLRGADVPSTIAFAYVDLDLFEPIKEALRFIDSHMARGGRVMVDDYGFFSEGAQIAVDEFVAEAKGRFALELPMSCAGAFCILMKLS
jgi:hypothetical protein